MVAPLVVALGLGAADAVQSGGGGGDTLLRTFTLHETSGTDPLPVGSYISGFAAFAPGDIPSGNHAEFRKADGTTAFAVQQYDEAAYHDDGSLRCCAYKIVTEEEVADGDTDDFTAVAASGAYSQTDSNALSDVPDYANWRTEVVVSGTTYTADLDDGDAVVRKIAAGDVCSEWIVEVKNQNGGSDHAHLWTRFHLRLYVDDTVEICAKVYNSYLKDAASISVTSAALKNSGGTVSSWGSGTLGPQAVIRLGHVDGDHKTHWTANEPAFCITQDMAEMAEAKLMTKALASDPSLTSAIGSPSSVTYDPYSSSGFFTGGQFQDQGGASFWIGLFSTEEAKALCTRDPAWHQRAMDLSLWSLNANMHYYEETGFTLPVVDKRHGSYSLGPDRSAVGVGASATLTITGRDTAYSTNASHYPGWAYYAYIMTGRREWLDEMQAHAVGLILGADPNSDSGWDAYTRNSTLNGTSYAAFYSPSAYNIRGSAWYARTAMNAAWVTPSNDNAQPYLENLILAEQLPALADYMQEGFDEEPTRETLGWLFADIDAYGLCAPWMDDYLATVFVLGIHRWPSLASNAFVTGHILPFNIGRALNGCPYNANAYRMCMMEGNNQYGSPVYADPFCTDWADVYRGDETEVGRELLIPSPGGCPSSGVNADNPYTSRTHLYPTIQHCFAIDAAVVGLAGASTVKAYFDGEMPAVATAASAPQWSRSA